MQSLLSTGTCVLSCIQVTLLALQRQNHELYTNINVLVLAAYFYCNRHVSMNKLNIIVVRNTIWRGSYFLRRCLKLEFLALQ